MEVTASTQKATSLKIVETGVALLLSGPKSAYNFQQPYF